jgi:phosphopantothenoylcysteine decarboxylase / phosphopantothenate---cysteine ligase
MNKRILLIIGGGIAAYKALELIRALRRSGHDVRCVMTAASQQFVTPMSVAALSENPVYTDLFSLKDEAEMGHIQLSRAADLVVVCPATADLLAKMAHGLAGDLASTVLLATDKPVLVVPAMNVRMWHHAATQRTVAQLARDGVRFVGPAEGAMACGEFGLGRMSDVADIAAAIQASFKDQASFNDGPLKGRHIIVTAGPTQEPIDPVRSIINRSSGKQGYAIANSLARLGADVTLISGPTRLDAPPGVTRVDVETARDMQAAVRQALPADVFVGVAAVVDWRVEEAAQKIKKHAGETPVLNLVENPDILAGVAALEKDRPHLVVGFAAETERVLENARAKRLKKHCDWMLANDVSPATGVFGGDTTTVHMITPTEETSWSNISKTEAADRLARKIADVLV